MRYFAIVIAFVCGCRREAPPPPALAAAPPAAAEQPVPPELAPWFWSSISVATGVVAEVRQTASERGRCRVSAALGSQTLWSVDACIATREKFRFVSPDALSLVVLDPMPDADDTVLGGVYRKGEPALALTPASLHLPPSAARIEGHKLRWLGPREQRETPEGVEVQLLDGSLVMVRFDARAAAEPSSAATPPGRPSRLRDTAAAAQACSPCSYTDANGVYHLVESADEIPAQYRAQAGRIRGSVQRADAQRVTSDPYSPVYSQSSRPVQAAPVAAPGAPAGPRNELGENFIEYTNRLQYQAIAPTLDTHAKCIDNSGASVDCSETGMKSHW